MNRVWSRAMLSGVAKRPSAGAMSNLGFLDDAVGLAIGNVPCL